MIRPVLVERAAPGDANTAENRRICGICSVQSVTINLAESPLSWLKARGLVSDRQFTAGELLRRDYESANLSARITMRWDAASTGTKRQASHDPAFASQRHIIAKQRFDGALAKAGAGLSDILWRVVCACEAMSHAERELGWPTRSGRIVLMLALDRVADYYQLP
jgi:Domain of unknown function (DUF6456)